MKNKDKWVPNKYVYRKGKLEASSDTNEVGVASRLISNIIAGLYNTYIPKYAKGKLIDLGCGKVPLYEAYRKYITDNICVDWNNSLHPGIHVDYECDLTRELPFSDGEFDTLILSDVLEHIFQPEMVWKEISRIMSPGGIAILNTPFFYCLHEIPNDYFRYTEFALMRYAEMCGFQVHDLRPIGGTPEILGDLLAKHFVQIPLIGRFLAVAVQVTTQAFIRTAPGKRISEKTGRIFPLGYFMVLEKLKSPKMP